MSLNLILISLSLLRKVTKFSKNNSILGGDFQLCISKVSLLFIPNFNLSNPYSLTFKLIKPCNAFSSNIWNSLFSHHLGHFIIQTFGTLYCLNFWSTLLSDIWDTLSSQLFKKFYCPSLSRHISVRAVG